MQGKFENILLSIDKKYSSRKFFLVSMVAFTLLTLALVCIVGVIYKHNVVNYTMSLMQDNINAMSTNINATIDAFNVNNSDVYINSEGYISYDSLLQNSDNMNRIVQSVINSDGFIRYFLYDEKTNNYFNSILGTSDLPKDITALNIDDLSNDIVRIYDTKYFVLNCQMRDNIQIYSYLPYTAISSIVRGLIIVTIIIIILLYLSFAIVVYFAYKTFNYIKSINTVNKVAADAIRANEAKDEFLSNMSHEIRTPINTILGMNEMILRTTTDSDVIQYAESIESSGRNLLCLINDILDFSKIESGNFAIVNNNYNLSELLRDTISVFKVKAENKNLQFDYYIDSNIPEHLYGDKLRIQQILNNLLSNAIKYTSIGEVKLYITFTQLYGKMIHLNIKVSDTGKGIREEDIGNLFTKFERLDMRLNNTIEGMGLGLAITQSLVKSMNGSITVDSIYEKGSVFCVNIEQKFTDSQTVGNFQLDTDTHTEHKHHTSFIAPKAQILVVDDTSLNLMVIKHLLSPTQIIVDTATCGQECVDKVKDIRYDLILLDARMPGIDGIETLHILRENHLVDNVPVIVLTANAINGAREKYLANGFDDYLSKPVASELLEDVLKKYLPSEKVITVDQDNDDVCEEGVPDWLLKVRALNINDGLRYCGSASVLLNTIENYVEASDNNIEFIEKAIASSDIAMYTIRVHALKSSSQTIGSAQLYEEFKALETAGNNNDIVYISAHTANALSRYKSLCDELRKHVNVSSMSDITIDPDCVDIIFQHIKDYADGFYDEALSCMLGMLSKYHFPENSQQKFNKLYAAFKEMDWVAMQEILES